MNMKPKLSLLPLLYVVALLYSGFELPVIQSAQFRVDSAACNASIAQCQVEDEFLLDSEASRRFLADGKHIGNGALYPDRPICDPGRGKPYNGCLPPPSNPPRRPCEKIYGCRGGS